MVFGRAAQAACVEIVLFSSVNNPGHLLRDCSVEATGIKNNGKGASMDGNEKSTRTLVGFEPTLYHWAPTNHSCGLTAARQQSQSHSIPLHYVCTTMRS